MAIKSLYRDYFQKSLVFLYPALAIERGHSVTPITTYLSWDGRYKPEDRRLVCTYYIRNDEDYIEFEKKKLLKNKLFERFEQLEGDGREIGAYIFNFEKFAADWDYVVAGKYSRMSPNMKKIVLDWMAKSPSYSYIDSYLNPQKYYDMYSELLGVDTKVLRQTVELCALPDKEQETLVAKSRDLQIPKIIT